MLNFDLFLIEFWLSFNLQATIIDPADVDGLEAALDKNKVSGIESGSIVLLDYHFMFTLEMTVHP